MRVFKFGGASVKDVAGVQNVVRVLKEVGYQDTLIVVSAMGKTTNAMEQVVQAYFEQPETLTGHVQEVVSYHQTIMEGLFEHKEHPVFTSVKVLFDELNHFLAHNKSPHYSFVYDQVVSTGELVSTTIINAYLTHVGMASTWLDARNCIKTDANYRDANVDWNATQLAIDQHLKSGLLYVTQGFIGSDDNNFTTTLGREGSDYSAAIFAYSLNATSVTIWKDVPGVLNADPRHFDSTELLQQISYQEAIELAFYGASVIHPKTLQPLQRKEIPLHVKSFINPNDPGTVVTKGAAIVPEVPCYIVKKGLSLIKLSSLDFSFIVEENISDIFKWLHDHKMKVDLIQNSAISFSVCVFDKFNRMDDLLQQLRGRFKVKHTPNISLYTIRHFDQDSADALLDTHELLLEQRAKLTLQLVMK